jgi:hypothetical protein
MQREQPGSEAKQEHDQYPDQKRQAHTPRFKEGDQRTYITCLPECAKRPRICVAVALCSCTMAPLPESQLLWVNKDVKSYKQSRKVSAAQASIINAHSQHQARAARNVASQRALRESSTVKAIVGWKQRSVSQVPQLPVVVPAGWSPVRFKIVASGSIADQIEERDCIKSQYCRLSILWALHFASWLPPSRARSDISAFAWDHDAERQQ